ncbi:hypothetical protein PAXINDRAFT_11725 [Paxillus involutus ATCC 200175]|uniref:Uncharacterized protein n=1 Tax=Paxillus involutus ATCC 200175 TaxID=664439 RepID=A0A0C9TIX0_PAXIN|nr:hypothetical protein PAXINDRAFT_11725 [Paxillus involutus ATCC 200175]
MSGHAAQFAVLEASKPAANNRVPAVAYDAMVFAEVGSDLLEVAFDPQAAGVNLDYLPVARAYTLRRMLGYCQH